MADLTPLQNFSLLVGIGGGVLGVINIFQSWWRNRPIVSVNPGPFPGDDDIEIVITNPASRPITITGSRCIREPHDLYPEDHILRTNDGKDYTLNFIIEPNKSERLRFINIRDGAFLLLIHWHSNAAVIFSFLPLVVFRTSRRAERLKRTKRRD